nr:biotin/lipoyl-binding protein [Clostridium sp. D46t1_190503_E9]
MTKGSGEIKDVFISEGSEVKEGDVLFKTNGIEANLQFRRNKCTNKQL